MHAGGAESPPSEFKFSDEEETNMSEHIGSNTNAINHMSEINKNLERQRVWQEQMNQIEIAKKNFHAVLLKDAKCKIMNLYSSFYL